MGSAGESDLSRTRGRREDPPLLKGEARYTDDIPAEELAGGRPLHAAIHRSRHANADLVTVDTDAAEALDGVIDVFTAADVAASDASGTIEIDGSFPGQLTTEFSMLADDRVRFTGEAIAVAVAEDRYTAHDAVERIEVNYERRGTVTDVEEALADGAPLVHESLDSNRLFDWEFGDDEAVEAAFRDAENSVTVELRNQRLAPVPLEPRSALGDYDAASGELILYVSTQAPHGTRDVIADMLDVPSDRLRLIAPDVGGGFGSKGPAPKAGEPLAAWCAMQVDRPVKWTAVRTENLRAGPHGRSNQVDGELAFDDDGRIKGLRVEIRADAGAYLNWGHLGVAHIKRLISGPYDIPAIHGHAVGALTNRAPIAPYRGAGRPEANFIVERLLDRAASALDEDPIDVRRRNFIQPDQFPFETAVGTRYDSGDYERALDLALETAGYANARRRQAQLRDEGRYLGVGVGCFVENTGTPGMGETARVELGADGSVTAFSGAASHGQGHATVFSQLLADAIGISAEEVEYRDGDTADLDRGVGTFASRSAAQAGGALLECAHQIRETAREVAADRLETDPDDVDFDDGTFHVAGAPERSIHVRDVVRAIHGSTETPVGASDLAVTSTYDIDSFAVTFGTHVAVVEVDIDSGDVFLHRYVAVDDCGIQLDPVVVEGQVHGGVVQGIEEAMYGDAIYDENATLVAGSLQDYALPRADDVPELETESTETPSPLTGTGAKGTGESGTIAAPPTLVNAVVDALSPLGVTHIDKPLTAETVWSTIREAKPDR